MVNRILTFNTVTVFTSNQRGLTFFLCNINESHLKFEMVFKKDVLSSREFSENMETYNTRSIVVDYIKHRVAKEGFQWENDGRQGSVTPNAVQAAMRSLGDEFEERFRNRFSDMIEQLNITDNNAYDTFKTIVDETFSDGVNWGRFVALFGFAGRFAVYCFVHNKSHLVDNVVEWVTSYIDTNLQEWMTSNNKWVRIV